MIATLNRWKEVIILLGFFVGFAAGPARIYAQDFVQTSVDARFKDVSEQIKSLEASLEDGKDSRLRQESDLASLKALLKQLLAAQLHQPVEP
jgi:hypothetical protein